MRFGGREAGYFCFSTSMEVILEDLSSRKKFESGESTNLDKNKG